jgi:hypothetical protein
VPDQPQQLSLDSVATMLVHLFPPHSNDQSTTTHRGSGDHRASQATLASLARQSSSPLALVLDAVKPRQHVWLCSASWWCMLQPAADHRTSELSCSLLQSAAPDQRNKCSLQATVYSLGVHCTSGGAPTYQDLLLGYCNNVCNCNAAAAAAAAADN